MTIGTPHRYVCQERRRKDNTAAAGLVVSDGHQFFNQSAAARGCVQDCGSNTEASRGFLNGDGCWIWSCASSAAQIRWDVHLDLGRCCLACESRETTELTQWPTLK